MAEEKTTDVREYLVVHEEIGENQSVRWLHLGRLGARSHEEALRAWALANPEEEAQYPGFHVITGSAVKGPLKGTPDRTYRLS